MHISKIQLTNIKCFEEFFLDLEKDGEPVFWTMIVGDNSVGKSCLLESIAIGLCDEASAAALMKELSGGLLRKNAPEENNKVSGSIDIDFKTHASGHPYSINTKITRKPADAPPKLKQSIKDEANFPWENIFICGYGPQRASDADRSYDEYDPLAAVYTLFNYEATLQNPELILRRQPARRRRQWEKKLLRVLMLNEDEFKVELDEKGMSIVGPWGEQPLWSLSDGYRSTTFWLLDFLAWQVYFRTSNGKASNGRKHFSGVLLIDELEQHLHPRWQRYIIGRLHEQFPKVQFITTTHSPLVALGVTDIPNVKIVSLKRENQVIFSEEVDPLMLKGMRADQVLTSDIFGVSMARSIGDERDILRFRELYLKDSLNKPEQREFNKLRRIIERDMPEVGETEEERKLQKDLKKLLDEIDSKLES
ncbi:MAG: AAA family ATPase [Deltaproteobacteria bacterium]|nr:AAA family ATPase [Deltaproteobacteria bacterium]